VINVFRKLKVILNSPGQQKFGANYSIEKLVLRNLSGRSGQDPHLPPNNGDTAISVNKTK
jgi:hypothetical protein